MHYGTGRGYFRILRIDYFKIPCFEILLLRQPHWDYCNYNYWI